MTKPEASIDPRLVSLLWAGPERAGEIAALHASLFDPAWDEASIARLLEHPGSTALVALGGLPRRTVGFIMGQLAADEAEILTLGVAPDCQRSGLGRRLVEGLIRAMKPAAARLFLEVADDNVAALGLYEGLGFTEVGRRKGYYQRRGSAAADAVQLAKAL